MNYKKFIKHPLSIVAIAFTLIILVVLIGTPYLIEKELNKWIVSRGPDRSQTDNVDFNPFTGRFALYNLQVETQRGQTLHIPKAYLRFSWKNLTKKRIYLKELVLEDTYLLVDSLEDTGFRIAGLILKEVVGSSTKKSSPGWGVGIERFEIRNSRVEYDTPQLAATYYIDQYLLTNLQSWNKQQPVQLVLQGRIDESPIHIDAEVTPFAEQLAWKGKLKLENAELSLISKALTMENIAIEGKLDIDVNVESMRQQDKLIAFSTEGDISIKALQIAHGDMTFADEKVNWHGTISGSKPPAGNLTLTAEGSLSSAGFTAGLPSQSMSVETKGLQWQGSVNYEVNKDSQGLTMAANLEGGRLAVRDTVRHMTLVGLKGMAVNTIDIKSLNDMAIAEIVLQKLLVFSKATGDTAEQEAAKNTLLQVDKVQVKDISWQDSRELVINDITLNDFQAYIKRLKEGGLYLIDSAPSLDTSGETEEKSAREPEPAGTVFHFRLDRLQVEGDSSIRFVDETTLNPFQLVFQVEELQVADIDTADTAKPLQIKVGGKTDQYSKVSLAGTALPFAKPISVNMKGEVTAFRMVPLSSYTAQTIGYNLTNGQLDADLNIVIDRGNLAGNTELRMRNLEVARVDPEKVPEIDTQMKVPLESGLAVLRNKKDVIKLDIALTGNLDNPQFSFQDAINQAIAKAMTFATVSFLKYTLQPFGTFIAIAEIAGKAGKTMTKIQLDSVQFEAAEISLDETAKQYLEKVAVILEDRPQLRLEVCGKAVEKDRTVLLERRIQAKKEAEQKKGTPTGKPEADMTVEDTVLQDFARERAKLVKDSLVNDHSVSHDRIYLCLPAIDATLEKGPYVELLID